MLCDNFRSISVIQQCPQPVIVGRRSLVSDHVNKRATIKLNCCTTDYCNGPPLTVAPPKTTASTSSSTLGNYLYFDSASVFQSIVYICTHAHSHPPIHAHTPTYTLPYMCTSPLTPSHTCTHAHSHPPIHVYTPGM